MYKGCWRGVRACALGDSVIDQPASRLARSVSPVLDNIRTNPGSIECKIVKLLTKG